MRDLESHNINLVSNFNFKRTLRSRQKRPNYDLVSFCSMGKLEKERWVLYYFQLCFFFFITKMQVAKNFHVSENSSQGHPWPYCSP